MIPRWLRVDYSHGYCWYTVGVGGERYANGDSAYWLKLGPVSVSYGQWLHQTKYLDLCVFGGLPWTVWERPL